MKNFLISLIIVLGLLFNIVDVNAGINSITVKQENYINNILDNYFIEIEDKYGKDKSILMLKNILIKVDSFKGKTEVGNKYDILSHIYDYIDLYLRKGSIISYYSYIEKGDFKKAFDMKVLDFWNEDFNREKELEKFKKIYNFGEKVKINIISMKIGLENNIYSKVEIEYLTSQKIEKYNVLMRVNPSIGFLPLMIKTISVNNPEIKDFF